MFAAYREQAPQLWGSAVPGALESAAAGQTADLWREPPAIFAELPRRASTASPEAAGADI